MSDQNIRILAECSQEMLDVLKRNDKSLPRTWIRFGADFLLFFMV